MTRHLIRIGAAVMTTLLGLFVLWLLRSVLLYVLIALALAGAILPLFMNLGRLKRPARLGMIFIYLLALVAFVIFMLEVGGASVRETQTLIDVLSEQDVWQQPEWVQGVAVEQFLNARIPPPSVLAATIAGERGQGLLSIFLGVTQGIFGLLSGMLVILFLGLYWSANRTHFQQLWLSLMPLRARKYARNVIHITEHDFGHYIRVEFLQSLLIGVLLGLGYWLLGSPYPVLLALIGALANLIPVLGPIIAVLVPLLIGLLTSLPLSLGTAALTIAVLLVVKLVVKPRLYQQQSQNPILTIFLLLVLADAFGLLGIIAAPPLAQAVQIIWNLWVSDRAEVVAGRKALTLRERKERIAARIAAMEEPPPILPSSLDRLNHLLERAEPLLRGQGKGEHG